MYRIYTKINNIYVTFIARTHSEDCAYEKNVIQSDMLRQEQIIIVVWP